MLVNREVILAKVETTYNTDSVPGAADAILAEGLGWANNGLRMIERPAIRANVGKLQQVYAGRLIDISFTVELKGSGAAGTAPEIGALLRGCGFAENVVASTSVTYLPVSTGFESITLYFYRDGKRFTATGCRGTVSFTFETGSSGKAAFTFTGHVTTETDTAMVTPSYDGSVPPALIGVPFSIGGYSAVINSLSADIGNAISTPPDISAVDGYSEVFLTGRDVAGSFDPEDTLVATNDWLGDFTAGNTMALTTGAIGAVAGNIYQIDMPVVYFRDVGPGDRDNVRTLEIPFGSTDNTGDDDFSLAFT